MTINAKFTIAEILAMLVSLDYALIEIRKCSDRDNDTEGKMEDLIKKLEGLLPGDEASAVNPNNL